MSQQGFHVTFPARKTYSGIETAISESFAILSSNTHYRQMTLKLDKREFR